jgi:hypothetical protein
MRIPFPDLSRPKAAAKLLIRMSSSVQLSRAQEAIARATGYRDWYDLTGVGSPTLYSFDLSEAKDVVLTIADTLGLPPSDVQYAVAKARLLSSLPWSLDDHLTLTTMIWRERVFGEPARGKPGTVVKVRAHGRTRPAYLRQAGRPSYVLYDNGPGMCADFELVTPRVPLDDFVPARLWLPYGYWTLADDSEVIFARDYLPMWRVAGESVERLDPWLWIEGISQSHVFSASCGTVIWDRGPARELALNYLARRRIFELPRLVDAMPHLIEAGDESTGRAVDALRCRVGGGSLPSFARLNYQIARTAIEQRAEEPAL